VTTITTTDRSSNLPIPEDEAISVLQSSLYPGSAIKSIQMVLAYCRASGLDPFQKPVHIVQMYDRNIGGMRDVIMPGVNLYRIQASRSRQFAGISEPEFGPDVTVNLGGQDITYPDWCRVTVKRQLASGHIAEFTAREYWTENYAVKGGKEKSVAPNAMWLKRPRGQLSKCASAQALRNAFPEIAAQYTAEEMEGKDLEVAQIVEAEAPKDWGLTAAKAKRMRASVQAAIQRFEEGNEWGVWEEVAWMWDIKDADSNTYKDAVWNILGKNYSAIRTLIKRLSSEQDAKDALIAQMNVSNSAEEA
jgi:phage recombination protein Bet